MQASRNSAASRTSRFDGGGIGFGSAPSSVGDLWRKARTFARRKSVRAAVTESEAHPQRRAMPAQAATVQQRRELDQAAAFETPNEIIVRSLWTHHRLFPPASISRKKHWWEVFVFFCVLYNCVMIPLQLTFLSTQKALLHSLSAIDWIMDSFLWIDIVVSFRTAYYDDNQQEIVVDSRRIAWRYATSNFPLEFVSTFPFEAFDVPGMALLKLPRLIRVQRLLQRLESTGSLCTFELLAMPPSRSMRSSGASVHGRLITKTQPSRARWPSARSS